MWKVEKTVKGSIFPKSFHKFHKQLNFPKCEQLNRIFLKFREQSCLVFTSTIKGEIKQFHVVVVQRRQRNGQKSVMHVQSCFFFISTIAFFAVPVVATVVVAPAPSYYYCQRVRQAKTPDRRGGTIQLISKRAILWGTKCKEIGHCRVPPSLCIKTKLSAQPLIWKWFFILMQLKLIFTRKLWNSPFPSSKKFHFQNEAKCEIFVVKMSFICIISYQWLRT